MSAFRNHILNTIIRDCATSGAVSNVLITACYKNALQIAAVSIVITINNYCCQINAEYSNRAWLAR